MVSYARDGCILHLKFIGGVCFGRLLGITKYTTRSDVCNLLDGCNLNLDDIKVEYSRSFLPVSMLIQFPSRDAYEVGLKATRRDRLHRLDMTNRSAWGTLHAYEGRSILLEEVPISATPDDVERFLSGCQYDPSTFRNIFSRGGFPQTVRFVTVSFPSQALAMHACITKDRSFCINKQISVRVLH
ncbi:hypothetical protein LIER_11743 [Lithospermum erythrorhizon]|uniref:RRM domain-containing protein n=1 Tax=Lithospermum erythrorhizon TaxID=34254 RepID=A0AAV3PRH6_LITER